MTETRSIYYFNAKEDNACAKIARTLSQLIQSNHSHCRELVVLCIGSDRVTGDSLGPMVGYKLQNALLRNSRSHHRRGSLKLHLYGTLEHPIHALNLTEHVESIRQSHPHVPVLAIDASLGNEKYTGFITLGEGRLRPGTGVQKELPAVGDLFLTGIVGTSGYFQQTTLQTTRLFLVMTLADVISQGILLLCAPAPKPPR